MQICMQKNVPAMLPDWDFVYKTKHEQVGPRLAEMAAILGRTLANNTIDEFDDLHVQFQPIMRFILTDTAKRLFTCERWCYWGRHR